MNKNHYISTNIYAVYRLKTILESSTDSKAAPAEQQPPTQTANVGTRQACLQNQHTLKQEKALPELMMQVVDLGSTTLQQVASGNAAILS